MNARGMILVMLVVAGSVLACQAGTLAAPGASTKPAASGASTALPQASGAAPMVVTAGPLSVSITSPLDEAVVNTPQVDVTGQAPPETVITINDVIVVVDASGQFSATVLLDEGPNELAIKASDPAGNEADSQLTVTYEPLG